MVLMSGRRLLSGTSASRNWSTVSVVDINQTERVENLNSIKHHIEHAPSLSEVLILHFIGLELILNVPIALPQDSAVVLSFVRH